jgi:trehalose/maltose hydrolase-like predicted phosphorylase
MPHCETILRVSVDSQGIETCPLSADTGLREIHISGDIALAVRQYFYMTNDLQWLKAIGWPLLKVCFGE